MSPQKKCAQQPIKLIVGLGNPGQQYANTRHNAGWMVIDELAQDALCALYWKTEHGALCAHVKHDGEELILAKPQSFMNASGGPVSKIASAYGIAPEQILVIHDEMDLPAGGVRVKVGGGHGGHNGLRSIHAKLGSNTYTRVRIGMGHPSGRASITQHVLSAPKGKEAELLEVAVRVAADAVMCIIDKGAQAAMNTYNVRA